MENANQAIRQKWKDYMFKRYFDWRDYQRSDQCINVMIRELPSIVAAMYMKKLFTSEKKAYVENMLREIKQEFRANLDEVSFLDDVTRTLIKENESAIKNLISYPDGNLLDNDYLNDYYRDLKFSRDEYLMNYWQLKQFNFEKEVSELPNKIYRNRIAELLDATHPNNNYALNTIELPANILQGNMFDLGRPDYMNYGYMGSAIAHEIIGTFGDPGNGYDANGALKNWWTTDSKKAYDERAKCFVDQYANYVANKANHTGYGINTLARNIADNGGLKIAYRAYVNSMRGKTPDKLLPGLDHSPNQMFWIATANMFCEKVNTKVFGDWQKNAERAPSHYRVIGSLSNSEEFAKDFKCPSRSKMNPVKKCSAW